MSDPQLVFALSGAEILGFNLNDGTLVKRLKPPQAKRINALIQRPNRLELYSAAVDGNIMVWAPEVSEIPEVPGEEGVNIVV